MTTTAEHSPLTTSRSSRGRIARGTMHTIPIVLASSLALSMNLTGPIQPRLEPKANDRDMKPSQLRDSIKKALAEAQAETHSTLAPVAEGSIAVAAIPSDYTVVAGDTISSIAGRYGISTATVLALNGLGWKSVIYPGQHLVLTKTSAPLVQNTTTNTTAGAYTVVSGDTIGHIAERLGVSSASLLAANGLSQSSVIYPGQALSVPGASNAQAAAPQSTASSHYTIVSGDSITSIAAKHGLTTAALLTANGLQASSVIYAGKTLVIPRTAHVSATAITALPSSSTVVPMTAEMKANAQAIVSVGRSLGVSDYGLVIALATAAQESTLRNLDWGDRDSVGLFQQRPSTGWGSVAELTTPTHAATLFFGGPTNPNKGKTRGLLDIPGWQSMTLTQAAQAVQISAYPDAYAKWETSARAWLVQLG